MAMYKDASPGARQATLHVEKSFETNGGSQPTTQGIAAKAGAASGCIAQATRFKCTRTQPLAASTKPTTDLWGTERHISSLVDCDDRLILYQVPHIPFSAPLQTDNRHPSWETYILISASLCSSTLTAR